MYHAASLESVRAEVGFHTDSIRSDFHPLRLLGRKRRRPVNNPAPQGPSRIRPSTGPARVRPA